MKKTALSGIILGTLILITYSSAVPVDSASGTPDTTATAAPQSAPVSVAGPVKKKINLFAPSQYDSVLSLVPGGDSIKQAGGIIGIGADEESNDIVIISFDGEGNPVKAVVPAESLLRKPVAAVAGRPETAAKKPRLEQDGRTWFILESTGKSIYTYPSAYSTFLDDTTGENSKVIGGLSLLTIGGVLYGTYAFTKNMELGYGKVALMNYGSTLLGDYYPQLMATFLHNATPINDSYKYADSGWWGADSGYRSPTATDQIRAWSSMLGFPLGIYLGSRMNIVEKDEYGKVAVMEYLSQTAGALAFALPVFFYDVLS